MQGHNACAQDGEVLTLASDRKAKFFCLNGAIMRVVGDYHYAKQGNLIRAIAAYLPEHLGPIGFNDCAGRTQQEVLAVLDKAIAAA